MEYSLTLTADEVNTISAGLAELPLKRAYGTYTRIVEQVRAQEQAAVAATQAELDAARDAENARVAAEAKAQRDAAIAEVRAAGQAAVGAEEEVAAACRRSDEASARAWQLRREVPPVPASAPVERLSQMPGAA